MMQDMSLVSLSARECKKLNELKKFTASDINVNQTVKYLQLET